MRFSDLERRRRLFARHLLSVPGSGSVGAVRAVTALHSSDPITPYLALRARVAGFVTADLDSLLWDRRSLWRLHAMRRTLFIVPTEEAAVYLAGAARDVARRERERLHGWLEGVVPDPAGWLTSRGGELMGVLEAGGEWSPSELVEALPAIGRQLEVGSGRWATTVPVASRLLYLLAMEGEVVRTRPAGSWRSSQYRWAATSWWHGRRPPGMDAFEARCRLVSGYLGTHGPATMADIRWWTGWTLAQTRAALGGSEVEEVTLESGEPALVVAGDTAAEEGTGAVAFLPGLDPTPMGWKQRAWYLGAHGEAIFDRNGNAGPTIWAESGIVGGWGQTADGEVVYRLLEPVADDTRDRIRTEAAGLTAWLDGTVAIPRFRTPLERELSK